MALPRLSKALVAPGIQAGALIRALMWRRTMSDRRPRSTCAALILAALSVLPAGTSLGQSVMLRREYAPGQISYIESETEIEQDISGLPMPPMKLHMKQLYGLWEEVESATGDKTKIVLTYDRAARTVEAPMMGAVEFDTDDPDCEEAAPQLGVVLKPMIGMALRMELDKDGKAVTFSGMDAIHKKISEKAVASMHWAQMQEEFTDERGMETWGTGPLLIYPNKKVKVGDTWKASSSIVRHFVGTIVTDYQYKVDRIGMESGRKIVSISATGTVSGSAHAKKEADLEDHDSKEEGKKQNEITQEEEKKADPEAEVSGLVSGTASYDVELGRIVKRTSESKVDIKIPLSKLMPNVPAGEEPQFANFKTAIKRTTLILTKKERNAEKEEARNRAEMRKKAEEDDDDDEEEDDD